MRLNIKWKVIFMKKLRKFMACIIVASLVISLMPAAFAAGIEPYVENAVNTVISTGFDWDTAVYPDSLGSDQSIYYAHKLALGKAWGFTYGVDVKSGTSTLDCAKGLGGKMVLVKPIRHENGKIYGEII